MKRKILLSMLLVLVFGGCSTHTYNRPNSHKNHHVIERSTGTKKNVENLMKFCNHQHDYKTIIQKDSFGNMSKTRERYLDYIVNNDFYKNLSNDKTKQEIMRYWAEILYSYYNWAIKKYKPLFEDKYNKYRFDKEGYFAFIGTLNAMLRTGTIPFQVQFNLTNIQNRNFKLNINYNTKDFGLRLFRYFVTHKFWALTRDRVLLMAAFFISRNHIYLPTQCRGLHDVDIVEKFLRSFVDLINKKDEATLRLAHMIMRQQYIFVDKYMFSFPKVKKLFFIGKKHYLMLEGKK